MIIAGNYTIRDFRPGDYPQLEELWKETGLADPQRGDDLGVIERCLRIGGQLLIMEENSSKKIIGSSWTTFDGRRLYIYYFAIHPDYQNKGLGTILARESLKFVKESGHQIKLEVHKENLQAKHVYEKLGFFAFTDYDIYMIRDVKNITL